MKPSPLLLLAASAGFLSSCVDPYYAGEMSPRQDGPRIIERQPVVVERHRYVDERPPVRTERYPETYREQRPYYGDPVPSSTYRRTTTRTYQDY